MYKKDEIKTLGDMKDCSLDHLQPVQPASEYQTVTTMLQVSAVRD